MLRINIILHGAGIGQYGVGIPSNFRTSIKRLRKLLTLWHRRSRSRRDLSMLDAHMLRDVGLSELDRHRESAKPFWR